MSYGTKYVCNFTNVHNEDYQIIFDYLNFISVKPAELTVSVDGLVIRSTSGDEDRLSPVLGTECLIKLFVQETDAITIDDLIAQYDLQVRITVNRIDAATGNIYVVFQGYIVVEDNGQPFLDKPFIISLRALDGLGMLKNIPLVDLNGIPFNGPLSVIQWLAQILYKTGQILNIRCYFNFFHASFSQLSDPLAQTFLDAMTFETGQINLTDINPADAISRLGTDDCYTALEKIVRCFRCRIFMENGYWHLVSIYEFMNPNGYTFTEYQFDVDSSGSSINPIIQVAPVARKSNQLYSVNVGKNEIIYPVNSDAVRYLKLATRWIEITYAYNQSLNKIVNQNLQDIDLTNPNPAYDRQFESNIIDETGNTFHGRNPDGTPIFFLMNCIGFELYGWIHLKGNYASPNPPDSLAYLRLVKDFIGHEFERFVVLEPSPTQVTFLKSTFFRIDSGDLIDVSVDFRTLGNYVTTFMDPVAVLLFGDDGTFWSLSADEENIHSTTQWIKGAPNFSSGYSTIRFDFSFAASPKTYFWNTASASGKFNGQPNQAPTSGFVQILLLSLVDPSSNPSFAPTVKELWFKNIQITITPFLSGSLEEIKGDYNFSGSNNLILKTESDSVEISDSPKDYFKGALITSGQTILSAEWSRFGITETLRFQQIMERIMYNLLRRIVFKIEGTFKGLIAPDSVVLTNLPQAGFLHSYFFTDGDFPTKKFILCSFENDIGLAQGRKVFVEVLQDANDNGFTAPDQFVFAYIFQ